jgi:hypothetical protein
MTRERQRMEAEQIDAELLMAMEFLRQPGTDPAAWIDGARQRLQRLIAALREPPAAVPSPEMPVIEAGDEIHYGARLFMRVHGTTADFCITADGPVPKRDVRAVFRDDGMKKIRE